MRPALLLVLLLLPAPCARAQSSFTWEWGWGGVETSLKHAGPLERAALLWLAWDEGTSTPAAAKRLRAHLERRARLGSALDVLPTTRPPARPADAPPGPLRDALDPLARLLAGERTGADVAPVVTAREALDRLERTLAALGEARPALKRGRGPASPPRRDRAWDTEDGSLPGRCLHALVSASLARRAPDWRSDWPRRWRRATSPEEDPLSNDRLSVECLDDARATDAPDWLGPVALVVLGARAQRALELQLEEPLDQRLDETARRWLFAGDTAAAIGSIAAVRSTLEVGTGLRRSLDGVVAALESIQAVDWRPPPWRAWPTLPDPERLQALDRALRIGLASAECLLGVPPSEQQTVTERLEELGWAALPQLLALADDEVTGPGRDARQALWPYLGPSIASAEARARWWSRWGERGASAWWAREEPDHDLAAQRRPERLLARIGREVRGPLGPRTRARLPVPRSRGDVEAWSGLLLELARRGAAPACDDILAEWCRVPGGEVAWCAALTLGRRGDRRGLARLEAFGGAPRRLPPSEVFSALELLLEQGQDATTIGESMVLAGRSDPALLRLLLDHARRPAARRLLLLVASCALEDRNLALARDALAPFGAAAASAETVVALLEREVAHVGPASRIASFLPSSAAGALARARLHPGVVLLTELTSGDAARVDSACGEVARAEVPARPWLESALRGDVAGLDSSCGLPLRGASPGATLAGPLAALVRGWADRPVTGRDVVDLVAVWRADAGGGAGLEVGLSRAPRGRFGARVRPVRADGPGASFRLEVDGLRRDPVVAAGEATDAALAEALAEPLVDLLLAPDALVDLRLRVWR